MTHEFHNRVLQRFADRYYGQIVGDQHVIEEIVIDENPFWLAARNNTKYLMDRELKKKLPIKVIGTEEILFRSKVYYRITEYQTVVFKQEKNHTFRELIDNFADFDHDNKLHFKLYKIMALSAHIDRVNFRVATNAGFGKDSIWECLHLLKRDVSVINPRSMPALEYRLFNKVLVLNELSNMESSQRDLIQEFLLLCGDMRTTYEKSTRAGLKTRDHYKIQDLSLICMFNDYEYYCDIGKDKKFFDNVFTKAVLDRFVPFKMKGRIDTNQFRIDERIDATLETNWLDYIKILRSLEYYRHNWRKELKPYKVANMAELKFSPRHQQIFEKIVSFVNLYSESKEEFQFLVTELIKCNADYKDMMLKGEYTLAREWGDGKELEVEEEDISGRNTDSDELSGKGDTK